jgi:hypothetical protein
MKTDYTQVSGVFPDMVSVNCTSSNSKDGTAINKVLIDDDMGFKQACCHQGNVVPSENSESKDDSDILNGIKNCCGAPGEIVFFPCFDLSKITELGLRLLPLIGQHLSRSAYPLLDANVYCGDSLNSIAPYFYHATILDQVPIRNTSGTVLVLPDLRGYFIRCLNPTLESSNQLYPESIKEHSHTLTASSQPAMSGRLLGIQTGDIGSSRNNIELGSSGTQIIAKTSNEAQGTETVPKHFSIYTFIRY